jgi:enterochelin esterase family protein
MRWLLALFLAATLNAETAPRLVSPEVGADGAVTFRFRALNARAVDLLLEGAPAASMHRDGAGVWTLTTAPLAPDYYGYNFRVDGALATDPGNPVYKANLLDQTSLLHVPGPRSLSWEINPGPRGAIHRHFYRSEVVGDERDFFVYTPPGYDPRGAVRYPVLYLLHGYSDDASGWIAVGRANVILDNLINQGRARPMIVVFPLGYGTLAVLPAGVDRAFRDHPLRDQNFSRFGEALRREVMPQVEQAYLTDPARTSRAIAGLSMGGAESLRLGLNDLDQFAWIGGFSSAIGSYPEVRGVDGFEGTYPSVGPADNDRLRLLWIACGADDSLLEANRRFRAWLTSRGVRHTDRETPGQHCWLVWRRNLTEFLPLLFR